METLFLFVKLSYKDFNQLLEKKIIEADIQSLSETFKKAYEETEKSDTDSIIINLHADGYFRFELSILAGADIEDYPDGRMLVGNGFDDFEKILNENIDPQKSKVSKAV